MKNMKKREEQETEASEEYTLPRDGSKKMFFFERNVEKT